MRVVSGTARGHNLAAPVGVKTRPTGDRMKEDLFNILAPVINGAFFLDLYCGSGAMGIEALSRGAKGAVFVDESKEAIAVTKANLLKTRLADRAEVIHMSVDSALKKMTGRVFDIIFMDPPYGSGITGIEQQKLLSKEGILVVECPINDKLDAKLSGKLTVYRQKKYARMQFVFYKGID